MFSQHSVFVIKDKPPLSPGASEWLPTGKGGASAGTGCSLTICTNRWSSWGAWTVSCFKDIYLQITVLFQILCIAKRTNNEAHRDPIWTRTANQFSAGFLTIFCRSSLPPMWMLLKNICGTVLRPVSLFTSSLRAACWFMSTSHKGNPNSFRVDLAWRQWGQPITEYTVTRPLIQQVSSIVLTVCLFPIGLQKKRKAISVMLLRPHYSWQHS